jgi:hypothetical protein
VSDHTVESQGGGEKFKRIEDLFGGAHGPVADALQLLGGKNPSDVCWDSRNSRHRHLQELRLGRTGTAG